MIAIGCDHGGFALKQEVMRHLDERQDKQNPLKTWLMPYKLILHPYPLPLFMVII